MAFFMYRAPSPTEIVKRPDPGIARGVWEAPEWAFFVVLAALILVAGVYGAVRAGWIRRVRRKTGGRGEAR
jgi:hypothetical protein